MDSKMTTRSIARCLSGAALLLVIVWTSVLAAAEPSEMITLWPEGKAPGPTRVNATEGEKAVTDRRRTFTQYTNISVPKVAVFLAPEETRTGAAVLVCPGGGMERLAYEHEGLEIADWLNPLGISVFVLKYRVPAPSSTALLDAQRALGIIRQRAEAFQIDRERIGAMGFSAGGELVLLMAVNFDKRGYDPIDDADRISCRPTHACLVYPGGIVGRDGELRQDIVERLQPESTPPMFIVHAFSDASMNSFALGAELKRRGISTEMHIYQEGGHGFGARDSALPLRGWKASYLEWIRAQGFFDKPYVSEYASAYAGWSESKTPGPIKPLSVLHPDASLTDALAVQRSVVRVLSQSDRIIGFKSGPITSDPFDVNRPSGPATGVLFESGRSWASEPVELNLEELGQSVIETELGFIVSRGLDISTRISDVSQIKGAFESVVRVIEIPIDLKRRMNSDLTSIDLVAANIGSRRTVVASDGVSPDDFEPDRLTIRLTRDGKELHQLSGDSVEGGIWERMMVVVNRIVDQGYTLRSGDLVISGALGKVHPADPGTYIANYGDLGTIEFTIK